MVSVNDNQTSMSWRTSWSRVWITSNMGTQLAFSLPFSSKSSERPGGRMRSWRFTTASCLTSWEPLTGWCEGYAVTLWQKEDLRLKYHHLQYMQGPERECRLQKQGQWSECSWVANKEWICYGQETTVTRLFIIRVCKSIYFVLLNLRHHQDPRVCKANCV